MKKQILLSILVVSTAVALIGGATFAYVSDTEISVGNTFTAGEVDLKIDYDCYYNELVDGTTSCPSWILNDLTIQKFFDFNDVKPGDYGEGTISLNVDNDVWICARVYNLESKENNCNEPEKNAEPNCNLDTIGELQNNIYFSIWMDYNCNNILDGTEKYIIENQKAKPIVWAIADPTTGNPLPAGKNCIGVSWNVPSSVGNIIQSDSLKGDIKFWAEQSRNNPDFRCKEIVHYPKETAYVGYEDRTSGDFDYNDFGIMDMHLKETYADDCLSEVDMDFTVKVKLAGDVHDIHIKRLFSLNTDYTYTIARSSPAQGTEKPAGTYTGSDDLDVILFDSATTPILGDKVTIHTEINHCDDYFNPAPIPPRWDLDPFMANYDPWMYDKSISSPRHIVDWQKTTTFGDSSPGIDVPYILVIPAANWNPPGEGVKITTPYQYFDDYYRSMGAQHPQWHLGL